MNTESKPRKSRRVVLCLVVVIALAAFLAVEYRLLSFGNRQQAFRKAESYSQQIELLLNKNTNLDNSLATAKKEQYIAKAREAAYFLDQAPATAQSREALLRLAERLDVDVIVRFDAAGEALSSTAEAYDALSLAVKGPLGVFQPMLSDKKLAMCRDLALDDGDKSMTRCTICWNDNGDGMVLVGLNAQRQLDAIGELVAGIPVLEGMELLVADRESGTILGATQAAHVGMTLESLGIADAASYMGTTSVSGLFDGETSCLTFHTNGKRLIVLAQQRAVIDSNIPRILFSLCLYLILVASGISFLVMHMTDRITNEHKNANTDTLTGLQNRRAYEDELIRLRHSQEVEKLTVVSLDLNGLKTANDTRGHEMGDALITALAENMVEAFHRFGTLYRTGGDEFMALLEIEPEELERVLRQFNERNELWTKARSYRLSVAVGWVRASDHPGLNPQELAALADKAMYEDKARYYRETGHDRRTH